METPPADIPEQTALPDLTETSLVTLLHSKDPVLLAGLSRLITLIDLPRSITSGWSSVIGVE